jgi:hypothetical protein
MKGVDILMRKKLLVGLVAVALSSSFAVTMVPHSVFNYSNASVVYAETPYLSDWTSSEIPNIGFDFTVNGNEATIIHLSRKGEVTELDKMSQVGDTIKVPRTVTSGGKTYTVTGIGTSAFAIATMRTWAYDTLAKRN